MPLKNNMLNLKKKKNEKNYPNNKPSIVHHYIDDRDGHQSPEKIWSELDSIRTKIANRDTITP